MIPASVAKATITRFERAVAHRACARAAGQLDHAITFEYRQSKRELVALLQLLRTGENPDNSMEDRWKPPSLPSPKVAGTVSFDELHLNKPAEPSPR